jgi:hypothetical protein
MNSFLPGCPTTELTLPGERTISAPRSFECEPAHTGRPVQHIAGSAFTSVCDPNPRRRRPALPATGTPASPRLLLCVRPPPAAPRARSIGLAEFERDLIRARTGEGRARAVARGVKMGRPPKLAPHQRQEAIKRRDQGDETACRHRPQLQRQRSDDFTPLDFGLPRPKQRRHPLIWEMKKRQGTQQKSQTASRYREQQSYKHLGRALPNASWGASPAGR